MKIIVILTLSLCSIGLYGQWTHKITQDDFDGDIRIASVSGTGTNFPYTSPILVFNRFVDKRGLMNFYISGAGYFPSSAVTVLLKFDGDPETYSAAYPSISGDGKTIFFSDFNRNSDGQEFIMAEILKKLQQHNRISVRVLDNYSKNDLKFSLSGSSKAIAFVYPELNQVASAAQQVRIDNTDQQKQIDLKVQELLAQIEDVNLYPKSLNTLQWFLNDLGMNPGKYDGVAIANVDSIAFTKSKFFEGNDVVLILSDGTSKTIDGNYSIKD